MTSFLTNLSVSVGNTDENKTEIRHHNEAAIHFQRIFTLIKNDIFLFHCINLKCEKTQEILLLLIVKVRREWLAIIRSYLSSLLRSHKFSDNFSDMDGFQDGG